MNERVRLWRVSGNSYVPFLSCHTRNLPSLPLRSFLFRPFSRVWINSRVMYSPRKTYHGPMHPFALYRSLIGKSRFPQLNSFSRNQRGCRLQGTRFSCNCAHAWEDPRDQFFHYRKCVHTRSSFIAFGRRVLTLTERVALLLSTRGTGGPIAGFSSVNRHT